MELIGEQYAVTLEQLARLIGCSYRTARGLRDRWCAAGWTQSGKLAVDLPPFVWLTSHGSTLFQSRFRTWEANAGLVPHVEAVTNVRLLLERELCLGEWECERFLAQRLAERGGRRRSHLPDGLLLMARGRVAIEVELTLKNRTRLRAIVEELSLAYDEVWYFASARPLKTLTAFAAEAPFGNVCVRRYPPIIDELSAPVSLNRP